MQAAAWASLSCLVTEPRTSPRPRVASRVLPKELYKGGHPSSHRARNNPGRGPQATAAGPSFPLSAVSPTGQGALVSPRHSQAPRLGGSLGDNRYNPIKLCSLKIWSHRGGNLRKGNYFPRRTTPVPAGKLWASLRGEVSGDEKVRTLKEPGERRGEGVKASPLWCMADAPTTEHTGQGIRFHFKYIVHLNKNEFKL